MTLTEELKGTRSIGWMTSVCLHTGLAFAAVALAKGLTLAPPPAAFTWTVAFVAPPAPLESQRPFESSTTSAETLVRKSPRRDQLAESLPSTSSSPALSSVEPPVPTASGEPMVHSREAQPVILPDAPLDRIEAPQPVEEHNLTPQAVASIASTQPLEPQEAVSPVMMHGRAAPVASSARDSDYSWLSQTIMRRMEELKRYPPEARLNHAEGKVVLKAVIRSDGSIEAIEVFQSSGHHSLDTAAVELLNLAAPFDFPRPLERPTMAVKIPLNYRLQ